MVKKDKKALLEQIKTDIINQNICSDLAEEATNLVMGHGNPDSEIVFIGEAPGKNEDIQGKPFVGAAGKFLDEMLATVGLNREDVYITNIVKYRPPNNRDPSPEEKSSFWPYLIKEISVIKPKILITLGRHSMENFLPNCRISQSHGQPKRIRVRGLRQGASGISSDDEQAITNLVILPLFHPAAALYNGSMRETLIEDFAKIPKIINVIKQEKEE